jgi:hypothetical protein
MYYTPRADTLSSQVSKISRSDRWFVYRRLQELDIPCWCPDDGSLWIGVEHCIHAILLRSTVQQFVATRPELVDWLERCWETPILTRRSQKPGVRSGTSAQYSFEN